MDRGGAGCRWAAPCALTGSFARSKSWPRPRVERAAQRRRWRMSHQRRLSSPPASALPDRYADTVTTSSSAPSRAGEWDSHQLTSRISWLGSASGSQPGQ